MKNRIKKALFELTASDTFNFKDPLTGYSPANEIQLSMIFGLLLTFPTPKATNN